MAMRQRQARQTTAAEFAPAAVALLTRASILATASTHPLPGIAAELRRAQGKMPATGVSPVLATQYVLSGIGIGWKVQPMVAP
jgi:hypothetical protein